MSSSKLEFKDSAYLDTAFPQSERIYVNGKVAPILKLKRGYEYYFQVKQCGCENTFLLTNSPIGKYNCLFPTPVCGGFDPVTHGCVKFKVTHKTPKYFYYQSSTNSFMGNLVIVEDE